MGLSNRRWREGRRRIVRRRCNRIDRSKISPVQSINLWGPGMKRVVFKHFGRKIDEIFFFENIEIKLRLIFLEGPAQPRK